MRLHALFLVVVAVAVNSGEVAELDGADGVHTLAADEFLQLSEQGGKAVRSVTVNVKGPKARAPEPTVKSLTPKHEELEKAKWKKKKSNKGKTMSKAQMKEVKRVAKVAAAKEINNGRKTKTALKKARRKEKETAKKIKKMKATIKKVANNNAYAANQKDRKETRKLKASKIKMERREKSVEKAAKKTAREKFELENADKLLVAAKKRVLKAKDRLTKAERRDEDVDDSITKSGEIVAKDKAEIEKQKETVFHSEHVLEHVEDHEEAARVEEKEARIKVEFEEEDAKKVKVLLKKLVAKRAAVDKFTKTLDKKAKRDFKAAKVGIAKAKGDYAAAKGKYDKFTKKVAKWEAKLTKTRKLKADANQGVVLGLSMGKDARAIKSAENHTYLRKVEAKDSKNVDKNDIRAKGQSKLMSASMKELEKAEALDTVSRKESNRVRLNRETMKAQVKKIGFYKKEVAEHEHEAEEAKKRAAAALKRAKTLRTTTEDNLQKAKSRLRWLSNVDIPLAIKAGKKAKGQKINSKQAVKEAKDALSDARKEEKRFDKLVQSASNKKVILKMKLAQKKAKAKVAKKQEQKADDKKKDTKFKKKQKAAEQKAAIAKAAKKKKAKKAAAKKKVAAKKKKNSRKEEVSEDLAEARASFVKKYGFEP